MRVLVTGGAGYIGSFVVRALLSRGHEPFVADSLVRGHREALPPDIRLTKAGCGETTAMIELMSRRSIDAVIHLAGYSLVSESMEKPGEYWFNNVGQTAGLLEACRRAGVKRVVFSSSAAVYGEPQTTPIPEDEPLRPTNTYGATKKAVEEMLADFRAAHGMGWVSLRYFNAAGAAPNGTVGEDHDPETHLIPLALAAAAGTRPRLTVFGADYSTPDGTCLRDYVHVLDLAEGHVKALEWLDAHPGRSLIANLGGGRGASVKEVLAVVAQVAGRDAPHTFGARRRGDPPVLVAAIDRAQSDLAWQPGRSDLANIVQDAWAWQQKHPKGYGG